MNAFIYSVFRHPSYIPVLWTCSICVPFIYLDFFYATFPEKGGIICLGQILNTLKYNKHNLYFLTRDKVFSDYKTDTLSIPYCCRNTLNHCPIQNVIRFPRVEHSVCQLIKFFFPTTLYVHTINVK